MDDTANEMPPTCSTGWVYVLENPHMPSLFKIGFTKNTVEQRIAELSNHTGVPSPFICIFRCQVYGPAEVEKAVHQVLCRHNAGKEFFRVSVDEVVAAIEKIAREQGKQLADVWRHSKHAASPVPSAQNRIIAEKQLVSRTPSTQPPASSSPSLVLQPLREIAPGQLTPETIRSGRTSATVVWVPLKGHPHEN